MTVRRFSCPRCRLRQQTAGERARCPGCRTTIRIRPRRRTRPWLPLALAFGVGVGVSGVIATAAAWGAHARAALPALPSTASVLPSVPDRLTYVDPGCPQPWDERAMSAEESIRGEFGSRAFAFQHAAPYLLAVERVPGVDDDRGSAYERILQDLYRRFRREFAVPLGLTEITAVLPVLVLSDRASYEAYCRRVHGRPLPPLVTGLYELSRRRIVMVHSLDAGPEVLYHEGVHQLVHHFSGYREGMEATWFHEGLASLFENLRGSRDLAAPPARLAVARAAAGEGDGTSLTALVGMRTEDVWSMLCDDASAAQGAHRAQVGYAEAAAFVQFLFECHRAAFHAYMRRELQGQGGGESLEWALERESGTTLSALEPQFGEFLRHVER